MIDSYDPYKPDPADGIDPDQWVCIRLGLKHETQSWLDELKSQFLAHGGEIEQLPDAPTPIVRRFEYYAPALPEEPKKTLTEAWGPAEGDAPLVLKLGKLLDQPFETRKALADALGVGDGATQRLLAVYFALDPRAKDFQRLNRTEARRKATTELWEKRKLLVELVLEQGIRGYSQVAEASGLSMNMLYTLVDLYDLPIQKFRRAE